VKKKNRPIPNPDALLASLTLESRRKEYFGQKNSLAALEAFLIADTFFLPLPLWVTDWVANAFRKYHASNGNLPLEQLLGLRQKKGLTAFQRKLIKGRDEMLLEDVLKLRALKVKRDTALTIVINKLKSEEGWNKTGVKLRTVQFGTLLKRYKEYLKTSPEVFEFFKEKVSGWSKKRKERYLNSMLQHLR
jgi:hypothetical protein